MTTQTLETIPEETVAPATPERVTSDVPKTKPATAKNSGRVASGKRLAERNRLAREAKQQAEAQKPLQIQQLMQTQVQVQQQTRQNNQATAAQTQATLFLGLVV